MVLYSGCWGRVSRAVERSAWGLAHSWCWKGLAVSESGNKTMVYFWLHYAMLEGCPPPPPLFLFLNITYWKNDILITKMSKEEKPQLHFLAIFSFQSLFIYTYFLHGANRKAYRIPHLTFHMLINWVFCVAT